MKTISITLNYCLANWIVGCAQKNKVTISEFVRDLFYEKMQQGSLVITNNRFKPIHNHSQINRSEMGYTIFSAKLLEKLVLTTQDQGEILHKLAFEETQTLLEQLNFNNNKQRFCINLEEMIFSWINSEANRLQLKVLSLIRKLLENEFMQTKINEHIELSQLSFNQKIFIKHQIMTCKLLEKFIYQAVEDPKTLIKEAQMATEKLLLKLSSKEQITSSAPNVLI